MKKTLVLAMRDEGAFLLEWIAHHLGVGFNDILICTNNCQDGSEKLCAALAEEGVIRHMDFQIKSDMRPQKHIYRELVQRRVFAQSSWTIILDSDEFICVNTGDGSLDALIASFDSEAQAFPIHWRCFGDAKRKSYERGRTLAQFDKSLPQTARANKTVKTLVRDINAFGSLANHAPNHYEGNTPLYYQTMTGEFGEIPKEHFDKTFRHLRVMETDLSIPHLAQINHYATRTRDSFLLRRKRGPGWSLDKDRHNAEYFERMNRSYVPERRIMKYHEGSERILADLRRFSKIAEAEAACLKHYEAALKELTE